MVPPHRELPGGDDLDPERFVLEKRLGGGGMGVVYRAWDRARETRVAVKIMRLVDGPHLYRFKREFRALADILHPNLVELYELRGHGDEWFFSMELVEGTGFLEWVRPDAFADDAETASVALSETAAGADPDETRTLPANAPVRARPSAELDVDRLRDGLRQLVQGLAALHRSGKLHRDIKPSNVLVDRGGRVVICDFGLVVDTADANPDRTREARIVGTPTYMAPEQAANGPVTAASDWYSVGVLLYHCLTGVRPFVGPIEDVLRRKQVEYPPPPKSLDPDVPDDLDRLCRRLMAREPEARPTDDEVLAAVGAAPEAPRVARSRVFVGRREQLEELRRAYRDSRDHSVFVLVHGPSGMGKTSLCRQLLDGADVERGAIVLAGRCYERESVPYKALDTLVDELSRGLLRLPDETVSDVIPRDVAALSKIFPVLKRVPAIADPPHRALLPRDTVEIRRRAFRALRQLLERLGRDHPVILFVDDLQWGDRDSAPFFFDVMESGEHARLLLLVTYRDEDEQKSPLVRELRQVALAGGAGMDVRDVRVGPLDGSESLELARSIGGAGDSAMGQLVRDAGGNPFLLSEVMQLAARGDAPTDRVDLDDLLRQRVARLPEPARVLLTASAVAGTPVPTPLLTRAAGVADAETALAALRAARLITTHRVGDAEEIEPYHDRIREAIVARVPADELARIHARIARSMEEAGVPDAESMVEHWLAAGERGRAGRYASIAAARAEEALAFERAAQHYSLALRSQELERAERLELLEKLAQARAKGGRLPEAGESFLEAAAIAEPERALDLRRRAAEQLLRAGELEQGLDVARAVLAEVGVQVPRNRRRALASVALSRLWLKLRGFGYRERSAGELDVSTMRRLDTLWSVSSALAFVDPMLGTWCQMRYLRGALAAGEPTHVVLGFILELGYRSTGGTAVADDVDDWSERTRVMAEDTGEPDIIGLARSMRGLALFLRGEWRAACEMLEPAEQLLLDEAEAVWNLDMCRIFRLSALVYRGRFRQLAVELPRLLREAEEQGDEYLLTGLRGWRPNQVWLALDDPAEARRQAGMTTRSQLFGNAFHLHHYYHLIVHGNIELYEGHGELAWERVQGAWDALEGSLLMRVAMIRMEAHYLRARCALATAGRHPERLSVAEAAARRLAREQDPWIRAVATLVRGCIAVRKGDGSAPDELARAAQELHEVDMPIVAAVAELAGGGDPVAARSAMRREHIVAPDRFAALFTGFGS